MAHSLPRLKAGDSAVESTDVGRAPPGAPDSVPDIVAPPPRHRRFPLFDGLRAIAVVSVVVFHVALATGAVSSELPGLLLARLNVGLAIFFLISGFLLYRPFIAHRTGGAPPPEILDYAKRRFLRIYPAYWLLLIVVVLLPWIRATGDPWWAEVALLQTLPVSGGNGCETDCALTQTWSLGVEVTFYAALPLYVLLAARLARGRSARDCMRAELLLLAVISVISLAAVYLWVGDGRGWLTGTMLAFAFWFALGMGMAVVSVGIQAGERRPRLVSLVVAYPLIAWLAALSGYVLLSVLIPPLIQTREQNLAVLVSFGVIAALLLAPAVFGDRAGGVPRRALANPLVAWIGVISYGIFLWHFVISGQLGIYGATANFGVALAGTLAFSCACAAISYYLVERPILRLKYRRVQDLLGGLGKGAPADSPVPREVP